MVGGKVERRHADVKTGGMKLCIDATPLLLRSAGVKTYVYHWAGTLMRLAGRDSVTLFPLLDGIGECVHDRSVAGPLRTAAGLALLHAANGLGGRVLGRLCRGTDVFHASHQLMEPPRCCPVTATIYDATLWLMPEKHTAANVRAGRMFAERVMKRAAGLIAISRSTRDDAVRIMGLDAEKIAVIYPGVSGAYFTAGAEDGRGVAVRYGLKKPYVLFVGTVEPRKNLGTLIEAWEQLPEELRAAFDLVVAGAGGWGDRKLLERLRAGIPGVRYLGYVPERDMPGLTAGAAVFAYLSLYEGFGLPVAQALAAGVPVVTSNASSLPEAAARGGVLVDPRSPAEAAGALERLLACAEWRERLGAEGAVHARQFTWENAAEQSWAWFRKVAGRG